jgi:hypothetical protein
MGVGVVGVFAERARRKFERLNSRIPRSSSLDVVVIIELGIFDFLESLVGLASFFILHSSVPNLKSKLKLGDTAKTCQGDQSLALDLFRC